VNEEIIIGVRGMILPCLSGYDLEGTRFEYLGQF
jgi:hypothetical protein